MPFGGLGLDEDDGFGRNEDDEGDDLTGVSLHYLSLSLFPSHTQNTHTLSSL